MKEEKNIISISKEELDKLYKELTPSNYVRYIQDVDTEHLWHYLTEYIRYLNNHINETTTDISQTESTIHVIQKGFRYYSEKNNALRYYLYGYFSRQQDELLQKLYIIYNHERIERILNKKHLRKIILYLYENEIVQQKNLVRHLNISKSNIDHTVLPLIECGLVEKIKARAAFYKLTASGYEYCRKNWNETPKAYLGAHFETDYSDDEFDKLQDFDKVEIDIGLLQTSNPKATYRKELTSNRQYWMTKSLDDDSCYYLVKRQFFEM